MRTIALLTLIAIFAIQAFAQTKPVAVKFAEVANGKEFTPLFKEKFEAFIKEIRKMPKSTSGFIAIKGDGYATLVERHEIVESKIGRNPDLKRRLQVSQRGIKYRAAWEMSQFWFVPAEAEIPYIPNSWDIVCPTLTVSGKAVVENKNEALLFIANVSGSGGEVSYRWSVVGGHIIKGQGTNSISVRVNKSMRVGEGMGVTATLKVKGIDPRGYCMDSDSYTTILGPIPNTD